MTLLGDFMDVSIFSLKSILMDQKNSCNAMCFFTKPALLTCTNSKNNDVYGIIRENLNFYGNKIVAD